MSSENKNKQHVPPMMRNALNGKPKNFKKAWGQLLSYTKPYLSGIIISILITILTTAITLVGPSLIEDITNLITQGLFGKINLEKITKITIILGSLYVFSGIINYVCGFIMATITRKISKNLRKDISRKINIVPLSYLDLTSHGDVLSRITNDVDNISHSLDNTIINVINSIIMLIGSITIMFINT